MKKPPKSVWLTAVMLLYAVVFFVYQFAVRHVGFSPRNVAVLAAAVVLIAAVWAYNRAAEKRQRQRGGAQQPTNNNSKNSGK